MLTLIYPLLAVVGLNLQPLNPGPIPQEPGAKIQDDGLIAIGKKSPDFKLKKTDGKEVELLKTAKANKATLVNFWFYD